MLAALVFVMGVAGNPGGPCSYETGYVPETQPMDAFCVALIVAGTTQAVVALAARRNWTRRVAVSGLVLAGSALAAYLFVAMNAYEHACD